MDLAIEIGELAGGPAHLAGSFFSGSAARPLLVCLPGGTYTRKYFELEVPGLAGYSFAEHFAAKGFSVLMLDVLGTGGSTRPAVDFGLADQAAAVAAALERLPKLIDHSGPYVCVAHSMGGYVALAQQAASRSYAALAVLGTSNLWVHPMEPSAEMKEQAATAAGRQALLEQIVAGIPERYIEPDRTPLAHWFHLGDVPDAVLQADAGTVTVTPRRCAAESLVPGIMRDAAARIDVPVFLGFGEVDVSPAPHEEVSLFTACPDITLRVLAGSAHCHNMAGTRHQLWERMDGWLSSVI